MKTFKIEVLHVPSYIACRCVSQIPQKMSIAAKDSFEAINLFLTNAVKSMGNIIHEIASYLQGPSFIIKDNHIELGKYVIYMRRSADKSGTIVTVKDYRGITVPNLGIYVKREIEEQEKYFVW
jgi:hypothetical protein